MRKSVALTVVGAMLTITAAMSSPAGAKPSPKVTGGIELSSPAQYVEFNAFDQAPKADKGSVTYTNFDYPDADSGVWNISGLNELTFTFQGVEYEHHVDEIVIDPVSTTATEFTGTGGYAPNGTLWTIEGVVDGNAVNYVITYTAGPLPGYTVEGQGTIAEDGSILGTATDVYGNLTWVAPAGSASEVLHYTAPVTCASVDSGADTAAFSFVIPSGADGLAGLPILVRVTDGGSSGAGNDTYGHTVSSESCDSAVGASNYPIVGGNLTVH